MRCVCCSSNMADADSRKNAKNLTGPHLCQVKSSWHWSTSLRETEDFQQISWKTWKFPSYVDKVEFNCDSLYLFLCMEIRAKNFISPRLAVHSVNRLQPCLYPRTVTHHHSLFLHCPYICHVSLGFPLLQLQFSAQYSSWEGTVIHSQHMSSSFSVLVRW